MDGGWGDGLVDKVPAEQTRGPEFESAAPMQKVGQTTVTPALGMELEKNVDLQEACWAASLVKE